jgi:hypothetical protein
MLLRMLPAALLAAAFTAAPVHAQSGVNDVTLDGYYRVRGFYLTHPDLDVTTQPKVQRYFQHRLRLEPRIFVNEFVSVHAQADSVDDQVWGSNPGNVLAQSTADTSSNLIVKRVWGEVRTPVGLFRVGRQGSHWGKGVLSNDGNGFRNEFGDAHYGDTYDRILFATKPLGADGPLTTAVVYDKIVETDLQFNQPADANRPPPDPLVMQKGDVDEVGMVLFWQQDVISGGVYGIYRWQNQTGTSAWIPDIYVKVETPRFHFDLEAVGIFGNTERGVTGFFAPGNIIDGREVTTIRLEQPELGIQMFGVASEVGYKPIDSLGLALEVGYASGDQPGMGAFEDGVLNAFSFDPDYNVGLLMFEHANRIYTLNQLAASRAQFFDQPAAEGVDRTVAQICAAACVNDTLFATRSEAIADFWETTAAAFIPSNGAVKNALYMFPKVRFQPVETVNMTLAFLWARANEPIPSRVPGAEPSRNYGFEVDYAVNYNYTENFRLGLQAGWFRPGAIFDQPSGERAPNMFIVQPRFTVVF